MCNPYDHTKDELFEAKHQCGVENGVKFIVGDDYSLYVYYFITKYNPEDYLYNVGVNE